MYLELAKRTAIVLHEAARPIPEPRWTTQNNVVAKFRYLHLRDCGGDGPPLLIVSPFVGCSSVCVDFGPEQSLVRACLEAGFHTYACDYHEPEPEHYSDGMAENIGLIHRAVNWISEPVAMVGVCQGGTAAVTYTSVHPEDVTALIPVASPLDFSQRSPISTMSYFLPRWWYEAFVALQGGCMHGRFILDGFKVLDWSNRYIGDPWELFWEGDGLAFIARHRHFRDWLEYRFRIPGGLFLDSVHNFKAGTIPHLNSIPIDLGAIKCPTWLVAGERDNITPKKQVFGISKRLGGPVKEVLTAGGHYGAFAGRQAINTVWPLVLHDVIEEIKG